MKATALAIALAGALAGGAAQAADGGAILKHDCASCHSLAGPAPQNLQQLWERKGPDLFYAGNKYREPWLVSWLQKPQRIRPAGMFYGAHVKRGQNSDEVDGASLESHPALNAGDAAAVAAALMRLKANDALPAAEKVQEGTISKSMGEMVFDKFLGCMACHEIEPGYGGLSGPELYTAARRLQPAFIASYIRSPQAWDPKTWMPNKHVSDANIQKLVHYFDTLSKDVADAK